MEKRLYVPYDVGTSNEYATFYKDQDRPMFDKPFKLITHDKYMHIDDTYTNRPVGYGTTSPVSSEANRKAQADKLRKKRVEDAKKAGAKVVDEASRREAARRRRRDSVIDATFAGRVQSEEQREWQKRKKLRMEYNEYLKKAKDYEKRKEDKKKRRQEAKAKAKKAWNKFKDMTFDTGNRRTEK